MEKFAIRLRELRTARNLTQTQLADRLGLSESGIQNYERGVRIPKCDVAVAMADFFAVSVDYILGRSDETKVYNTIDVPAHISEQAFRLLMENSSDDFKTVYKLLRNADEETLKRLTGVILFYLKQ